MSRLMNSGWRPARDSNSDSPAATPRCKSICAGRRPDLTDAASGRKFAPRIPFRNATPNSLTDCAVIKHDCAARRRERQFVARKMAQYRRVAS